MQVYHEGLQLTYNVHQRIGLQMAVWWLFRSLWYGI